MLCACVFVCVLVARRARVNWCWMLKGVNKAGEHPRSLESFSLSFSLCLSPFLSLTTEELVVEDSYTVQGSILMLSWGK